MQRSKEKMIGMIVIAVSIVLTVAGYLMLPDNMIVQIGLDGKASNMLPKIQAILIPFAISTISSIMYIFGNPQKRTKYILFAVLGLLLSVVSFFINYGK